MTAPTLPVFTKAEFETLFRATLDRVEWLMQTKGGEYASGDDRLANFRMNAKELGTKLELVWGIYATKHWDAIRTYISDTVQGRSRERSEPIESRIDDFITYLILFKAIVQEIEGRGPRPIDAASAMLGPQFVGGSE